MRSVYEPSEVWEVAQLQKFFFLNLPKSICNQSSIMVISWNIDKNYFLSIIFDKISNFCQKVQKWAQKLQFWANWASSMNFWLLARLEMYVRAKTLYFHKNKKFLKLGNFMKKYRHIFPTILAKNRLIFIHFPYFVIFGLYKPK